VDLKAKLADDLTQAMKQREAVKVSTLRLLISAIRNKEIEKKKDLAEGDILEVIQAEAKRRKESIDQYKNANRVDLADKEETERKVLAAYLPEEMSEAQLKDIVQKTLQDVGAAGPQDMGKIMAALMPKIKGRVDGRQAQQVVQQLLKK
jgi:uncharacterized protein YqeY